MTTLTHLNLPDRQESELAQRGQRELAAYLSTRLETQRIAIVGEDDKAHTIELPTSALTLLMEILGSWLAEMRYKSFPYMRNSQPRRRQIYSMSLVRIWLSSWKRGSSHFIKRGVIAECCLPILWSIRNAGNRRAWTRCNHWPIRRRT